MVKVRFLIKIIIIIRDIVRVSYLKYELITGVRNNKKKTYRIFFKRHFTNKILHNIAPYYLKIQF